MAVAPEEAKQKVAALVAAYEKLTPAQVKTYNEARTKQHFVLPLFQALGWDIFNTDEVTPEESASKGRVDYADAQRRYKPVLGCPPFDRDRERVTMWAGLPRARGEVPGKGGGR